MKRSPISRRTAIRSKGRPKPVSQKRQDRAQERRDVIDLVHRRDRTCQAVGLFAHDCSGASDVHEVIPRSAWAEGIYEPANCIYLCRRSHDLVTNRTTSAVELGLHVLRSTVDRIGHERAIVAAAIRRELVRSTGGGRL